MYRQRYAEHTSRNYDLSMPRRSASSTRRAIACSPRCLRSLRIITGSPQSRTHHISTPKTPKPVKSPAEPPNPRTQHPPTREYPAVAPTGFEPAFPA